MTETALAAAFRRAGFDVGSRLGAVVMEVWRSENGDRARFAKTLWARLHADTELRMAAMQAFADVAAYEMSGEGHFCPADEAGLGMPSARQQNGGGAGHLARADDGQPSTARPSPQTSGGEGQNGRADEATRPLPSAAAASREAGANGRVPEGHSTRAPAREPTVSQRRAAKAVAKVEALTVLDRFKLTERNGAKTVIGDIRVDRLDSLGFYAGKRAFVAEHESKLTYLIKREIEKFPHVPEDARVRDILDAKTVERLIEEAKELAGAKRVLPADWTEAINA